MIAEHLNALGVPPSYTRDGRLALRGKRKVSTAGFWRAGRIRNMLVNPTYKGLHHYGRRSGKPREIIARAVPAIVSIEQWERAQQVLREHLLFSHRNAVRFYPLRGLITCGLCGLTYVGTAWHGRHGQLQTYYQCNGAHGRRGLHGAQGTSCPSKAVKGDLFEEAIWNTIQTSLHTPGDVLSQLAHHCQALQQECDGLPERIASLHQHLQAKTTERDAIITLFRRGRIDEAMLGRQLEQIQQEEAISKSEIERLTTRLTSSQFAQEAQHAAEEKLHCLREHLDAIQQEGPLSWQRKRFFIEELVERIGIQTTFDEEGRKSAHVGVIFSFGRSTTVCTGRVSTSLVFLLCSLQLSRKSRDYLTFPLSYAIDYKRVIAFCALACRPKKR